MRCCRRGRGRTRRRTRRTRGRALGQSSVRTLPCGDAAASSTRLRMPSGCRRSELEREAAARARCRRRPTRRCPAARRAGRRGPRSSPRSRTTTGRSPDRRDGSGTLGRASRYPARAAVVVERRGRTRRAHRPRGTRARAPTSPMPAQVEVHDLPVLDDRVLEPVRHVAQRGVTRAAREVEQRRSRRLRRHRADAHDGQHDVAARLRRRRPVLRDHDSASTRPEGRRARRRGTRPGSNRGATPCRGGRERTASRTRPSTSTSVDDTDPPSTHSAA